MSIDKQLAPFLREIADSIENDNILPYKLQKVGEFYMAWKLMEESENTYENSNVEDMDLVKFVVLGWFIYKHIINN